MEFNKYQSRLDQLYFKDKEGKEYTWESCPDEVKDEFMDCITTIPLIKWLIAPDRPYVKDLPRDEKGRAIIDITHPPILTDTDYFRPTALHYIKHGTLTNLRPNRNPNSEYMKWFNEENDRIWNGYLREEDGAYISGNMYWYLNYAPMTLTKTIDGIDYQMSSMPDFWEGVWWRYTGWWQARRDKANFAEISSRGKSKSYSLSAGLSRIYTVGDFKPPVGQKVKNARAVVMAGTREFLTKDGTLNKFEDVLAFLSEQTQYPSKQLQASLKDMTWQKGYVDLDKGTKAGTLNTVLGVAIKEDTEKSRGKRAALIGLEEFGAFPNVDAVYNIAKPSVTDGDKTFGLIALVGCVCKGTKVYKANGEEINIEDLKQEDGILGFDINSKTNTKESITYIQKPAYKPCVRITMSCGRSLECSEDHPVLVRKTHTPRACSYKVGEKREVFYTYEFIPAGKLTNTNRLGAVISLGCVGDFGTEELEDSYLIGLLIGDGSYGYDKTPRLSNCDPEVLYYVKSKYDTKTERSHITKDNKLYEEIRIKGICSMLRTVGIYGQVKEAKRLPINYKKLSAKSARQLLAGIYDTDGTISNNIMLTSSSKELLLQVKELLLKFGIYSSISRHRTIIKEGRKDRNDWFTLIISNVTSLRRFAKNIPLKIRRKAEALNQYNKKKIRCGEEGIEIALIKKVEKIGVRRVYNLTANNTHTYIANGIVTHNTGGAEGVDFSGALNMIYHPKGYGIKSFENVWDREGRARGQSIFCFPSYVNRSGCMNEDGISDVTQALFRVLIERYIIKYNSSDPMQLTRTKAEFPITLQDAIMQRDGAYFPTAQLMERLQEIDADPNFYDGVYVGDMRQDSKGKVEFVPMDLDPIRAFPHKNNKIEGAVEIYEMPKRDAMGNISSGRYVGGLDPIDDDESGTMSLVSLFILDLWTDRIVCEWTGRLSSADDCYERVRLIVMYYNAQLLYENNKKGVFTYFKRMNCINRMMLTPSIIKDTMPTRENINNTSYGVNATTVFNQTARFYIKDWLLKSVNVIREVDGEQQEVTLHNYNLLRQRALIQELAAWNPDGNFDRVSALGILMVARQELLVTTRGDFGQNRQGTDADYKGKDEYFQKNWDRFKSRIKQ